jgi:hypothetical protein
MISNNAVLLSAFAASALAAPSAFPSQNTNQPSTPSNLWKVPSRIDPQNPHKLAWPQINATKVTIEKAANDSRRFSYYPTIYNAGGIPYLLFSSAEKDIDGMGQDVWISYQTGDSWSKPEIAFPAALLSNQTTIETSEYYCKRGIPQRALQPLSIVYAGGGESSPKYYAVAQSSDNICPGSYQSAGRLARRVNIGNFAGNSETFAGEPCWIETNDYTGAHWWAETIYGTKYRMDVCEDRDAINAALAKPENVPAQATALFNSPIIAADGKHSVVYPTEAVWVKDILKDVRYMRFWADVSAKNATGTAFVEYTNDEDGKNWFPATTDGSKIHETNIYSSNKAWYGGNSQGTLRVYISNSGMNADSSQELLTLATSRGSDLDFTKIGVLRGGDASKSVPKGTRGGSSTDVPGFYWPSACFQGDRMLVAYSENKASIQVSTIQLSNLP